MSLGILQTGPGRSSSDGILGSEMASGYAASYRGGSLGEYFEGPVAGFGEYFEGPVAGLGCSSCRGMGAEEGISVPTSLVLGVAVGAGLMYLFGKDLIK